MSIQRPQKIPNTAGVYVFKKGGAPLYIGKAANLKKRLTSYFTPLKQALTGQGKNVGGKVAEMLQEATKLDWIETKSEVEALIKEAELIKKYRPKYNYTWRDDKNYFYVGVTREQFPRIFITHQPSKRQVTSDKRQVEFFGPFTDGAALKSTLRLLRRTFPYCTCKKPHKRPCLNSQIGRCPGFCCFLNQIQHTNKLENVGMLFGVKTDSDRKEYGKNIKNIIAVLSGRKKQLLNELSKKMRRAARGQDFEKAAKIRDQIFGLENVFRHRISLEVKPFRYGGSTSIDWRKAEKTIRKLLNTSRRISRVEGYDISNISGKEATGSMVVFIDGVPAKSEYRKFKIKTVYQPSDVDMLKEVIRRRLAHTEWRFPDLMLIDGGKPQFNAALVVLRKSDFPREVRLPEIAALAKREEELYTDSRNWPIKLSILPQETAFFFQRVRDESHRFAKKYHHKLREISYRE